jgi:hypothetical protein
MELEDSFSVCIWSWYLVATLPNVCLPDMFSSKARAPASSNLEASVRAYWTLLGEDLASIFRKVQSKGPEGIIGKFRPKPLCIM